MKFSEAIKAGALLLGTRGPEHVGRGEAINDGDVCLLRDVLVAAQAGLLGRRPTLVEVRQFYWENPWNAVHGTELELWCRLTIDYGYSWADVIRHLRKYDA